MSKEVAKALATGSHKIGSLVWYDCRDVSITPSRLRSLFEKHGMSKGMVDEVDDDGKVSQVMDFLDFPDNIKPKNAFQKSVRRGVADLNKNKSSDERRSIAKQIVDGPEKLIYGIVDLNVHEKSESIDPDFSDRVYFNKETLVVSHEKGHDLSKLIKKTYDTLVGEYTTRDISRMIVQAMDRMCSISLREGGVVYFVPIAFEKDLLALQAVVNDLGSSNMQVYALASGEGNAHNMEQAARSQIADKIEKMKTDLAELIESIEQGTIKGQTIKNSFEVRVQRFNDLKNRCRVLADALRIKADDLEGDLEKVDGILKNELQEMVGAA